MKPVITVIFAAVALTLAAGAAQAADNSSAGNGASSVAGMLQRKHDTELRAHLVSENRWEEIRQMDIVTAQRLAAQHDETYERVNQQLAHDAGADGLPIDARALQCDPDVTHVR